MFQKNKERKKIKKMRKKEKKETIPKRKSPNSLCLMKIVSNVIILL